MKLEVKKIGNSTGLIFPKELMLRLGLKPGSELFAVTDSAGGVRLTPYDPDFEASMSLVDDIMDEYKDTLKELAK
jgi:putative addiction module antidote